MQLKKDDAPVLYKKRDMRKLWVYVHEHRAHVLLLQEEHASVFLARAEAVERASLFHGFKYKDSEAGNQ